MNRFQNAVARLPQNTPPVWMMRQAGRYHAHYQALRAKHSFMELCKIPELAAEVAMGPIQDFDFDAAILFSDLLFPLEALGFGLEYTEQGPRLGFSLTQESRKKIKPWQDAVEGIFFQKHAVELTRERLPKEKSLIGFVGSPWTLFVYAVEGSHAGSLVASKKDSALWQSFAEVMLPLLEANIQLQLDAGVELVMLFDTAAGELSPLQFEQWVEQPLLRLAAKFPGKLGYYSKHTHPSFLSNAFLQAPWAGCGFDHRTRLHEVLPSWQNGFLQGNFDQSLLHQAPADFEKTFRAYLRPFQELTPEQRVGWVAGLGHGVLPKTPEQNIRRYVEIVREVFA